MKQTVAEKAKDKALTMKKEETLNIPAIATKKVFISNIIGIEPEDINLPYVYIVQDRAKHAVLENGEKATPGRFFHGIKKKQFTNMEVIIMYAKKGTAVFTEKINGVDTEVEKRVWRTLMVSTTNLYEPFSFTFKGMNMYYGWKPFLSIIATDPEIKGNPHNIVVKLTSKEMETQTGYSSYVANFEIVRETSDDEKAIAVSFGDKYSPMMEVVRDEDEFNTNKLVGGIDTNEETEQPWDEATKRF